jgi:hypothetical protein
LFNLSFAGSLQRFARAPPPPPPPPFSTSTNNGHHMSSTSHHQDNVPKSPKQINPNGPPPPPPPPRGVIPNNYGGGTLRRPSSSSDFVDHSLGERRYDQTNSATLDYDHHFESRFHFTPLEHLPIPERWQPPPPHTRSSKQHVNVR